MSRNVALMYIGGLLEIVGDPPGGAAGAAYSFTFTAQGTTGPYVLTTSITPSSGWTAGGDTISKASPTTGTYTVLTQCTDALNNSVIKRSVFRIV